MKNHEKYKDEDTPKFLSIKRGKLRKTLLDIFVNHADDVVISQNYDEIKDPKLKDPVEIALFGTNRQYSTPVDIEIVGYVLEGKEFITIKVGEREYLVTPLGVLRDDAPEIFLDKQAINTLAYSIKNAEYDKGLAESQAA